MIRALQARLTDWNRERRLRYHGYAAQAWIRLTRPCPASIMGLDGARAARRSDTLFVLGSGPSIRRVTPDQWTYIAGHDSFGINYSFLLDFVPTFHLLEDGKAAWHRALAAQVLAPRRGKLAPAIWFISNRHTRRLIHPRYTPELFPEPARVCIFQMPSRILLDRDRAFVAADFARTLRYRGTMSLVLHLARELGYRRLVLLGVDLHTSRHFFDDFAEMRPYAENVPGWQLDDTRPFAMMEGRGALARPIDDYLVAVDQFWFRPRGGAVYAGAGDSQIAQRLETFRDWDA